MKKVYLLFVVMVSTHSFGATIDWLGGTSSNWNVAANWSGGTVPTVADDVRIGVITFTNQPTANATTTIASLTFGATKAVTLTVNSGVTLTVSGNFTQVYSGTSNTSFTAGITGLGTFTCNGSFTVGNNTAPPTPTVVDALRLIFNGNINNLATVNLSVQTLNIGQNLSLNTTSSTATLLLVYTLSNANNSTVNINNGTVNVSGNINLTNANYVNTTSVQNASKLLVNPNTNTTAGTTPTLGLGGVLNIAASGATLDFNGQGSGVSTFNYIGASAQNVYLSATNLDSSPSVYQNIGFSGNGIKTVPAGTLTVPGHWTSSGGKIDLTTNLTNVVFSGTAQTLTDGGSNSGAGLTFHNVSFQGSGNKTLSSGNFSIASTGVLTMAGTATLVAGGNLTLKSDAAGTATVATLPSGTSITGTVNVQRFFKGSSTDLSKRGYRLISSAVYTGTPSGIRSFDLNYMLNDVLITGASGGGFNSSSTNPTLYLYREDVTSSNASLTSGNYKGIAKINNTNSYDIGTQKRLTTTNIVDTTTNLPVGNGVMFFFRGNKSDNSTQTGTKTTSPFDYPEDVTLTQAGTLNTGTVNVKLWYDFNNAGSYDLSYTNSPSVANSDVRGFALVGNPYPATINWEKFNRNGANSAIYGQGFPAAGTTPAKIWVYNPSSKQFDTYVQNPTPTSVADTTTIVNPTGSLFTGAASNMIASGQGFFIQATTTGQRLSFREQAKSTVQPTTTNILKLMSAGGVVAEQQSNSTPLVRPIMRLKLIKDNINTDEIVLALNDHTDIGFDAIDDVMDLHGNGAQVSLSVVCAGDKYAAIKQLKYPETQHTLNLMVNATATGLYQLNMFDISNLPAMYKVWLKDTFTADSLEISANPVYNFNIDRSNAATYGNDRFKLVIPKVEASDMHLLSFSASEKKSEINFLWKTENEGKVHKFFLQKSVNKTSGFTDVAMLNATNAGNYSFNYQTKENAFYRLKIENLINGAITYSDVIEPAHSPNSQPVAIVTIYPNPTANAINIKMPETAKASLYSIRIMNSSGRVVKQATTSQQLWNDSVDQLLPGTYVVQITDTLNNTKSESKFIKL